VPDYQAQFFVGVEGVEGAEGKRGFIRTWSGSVRLDFNDAISV
jgi:hypothetical protein